jgi:hypothetical protein
MAEEELPPAPLPFPWGVIYSKPNPDGSRKMCMNCMMWSYQDEKCSIHRANLNVPPEAICGYHVFGEPMEKRMPHKGMDPVDEALSGFDVVRGGTSCDICIYFEPTALGKGVCHAVAQEKTGLPPQPVQPLGCCARWEGH